MTLNISSAHPFAHFRSYHTLCSSQFFGSQTWPAVCPEILLLPTSLLLVSSCCYVLLMLPLLRLIAAVPWLLLFLVLLRLCCSVFPLPGSTRVVNILVYMTCDLDVLPIKCGWWYMDLWFFFGYLHLVCILDFDRKPSFYICDTRKKSTKIVTEIGWSRIPLKKDILTWDLFSRDDWNQHLIRRSRRA